MIVSYKGFAGELIKMERVILPSGYRVYKLEIYDEEKNVKCSFYRADAKDIKFIGSSVSFV